MSKHQQQWSCLTCTFASNPGLFLACQLCNTPRNTTHSIVPVASAAPPVAAAGREIAEREPQVQRKRQQPQEQQQHHQSLDQKSATRNNSRLPTKRPPKSLDNPISLLKENYNKRLCLDTSVIRDDNSSYVEEGRQTCQFIDTVEAGENDDDGDLSSSPTKSLAENNDDGSTQQGTLPPRCPPRYSTVINNLSDRQYCCVWSVEVFEDGYRPDVARMLLASVARHVNPILRERGWRVKRLIESASSQWLGLCTTNGRADADAASTNIQLNIRVQPTKHCRVFRSFSQILDVMLHEITHTSIGLEDIHPPAFWELLEEIKQDYQTKYHAGEVALETDDYGCHETVVTASGQVKTIHEASLDILGTSFISSIGGGSNATATTTTQNTGTSQLGGGPDRDDECGVSKQRRRRRYGNTGTRSSSSSSQYSKGYQSNVPKRKPLLKGAKMIDGRSKQAKASKEERQTLTPRELAARAALARFGPPPQNPQQEKGTSDTRADSDDSSSQEDEEEEEEDAILPHVEKCGCRSCDWDKRLFLTKA